MIKQHTLSSHYIFKDQFPELFLGPTPLLDGKGLAILDVYRLRDADDAELPTIEVVLPRFVNVGKFAELSRFYDQDGNELACIYEPLADGALVRIQADDLALKLHWQFGDERIELPISASETEIFASQNSAIVVSIEDAIETIAQWVNFHRVEQDLQALCLMREHAPSDDVDDFIQKIETALEGVDIPIVILNSQAPLGRDAAPLSSVWQAPDAPGKERMVEPSHNCWRSEINSPQIYEIMRRRFLRNARAVLNIAACDLLPKRTEHNIFDETINSPDQYLQLYGERVYPWRMKRNKAVGFGDHCTCRFDSSDRNKQWCVVPNGPKAGRLWNPFRVGNIGPNLGHQYEFWRFMALRHYDKEDFNPTLAPKTALVLYEELYEFVKANFADADPVLPPVLEAPKEAQVEAAKAKGDRLIVTTMKNEGPFLLEWIAYHRAIGFDKFIVYTNDCTDGTDEFLDLLQERGIVEHYDNPYQQSDLKPQHAALFDARERETQKNAEWLICMDCDEFVNIKTGDGTLDALFEAVGDANMISLTWRLFGNSDVVEYHDRPVIEQFTQCAHEVTRFPHQAWGVKTLYRNLGFFKKMGVHRPKGLLPQFRDEIRWVNGSGQPLPDQFIRNGWRTGLATYGYDLVQLNHYACRSMESFLVKRDRGRVNHVDRDQGLAYWFRMNHNPDRDLSILRMLPKFEAELNDLKSDPRIAEMHEACVVAHQLRIFELLQSKDYQNFFNEINSERNRTLARILPRFGMNVFLGGPDMVPDQVIDEILDGQIRYYNPPPGMVGEQEH